MTAIFCLFVDENHDKLPTLYRMPKLQKDHINHRKLLIRVTVLLFTELSILLTSCKYCEKVYERNGNNLFGYIKNSGKVHHKLIYKGFLASIWCVFIRF